METMELFSTFAEFEKWLAANKDKAQEYIKKNDVNFKNVQISTRAYNVLRINGLNYMSDIVFLSAEEINNLKMMNKTAADEILMFKRNYLRKHKRELINFVTGTIESQEMVSENRSVEEKEVVTITEQPSPANETSSQNSLYYIKSLLSDKTTKEKIIEFVKVKNAEIEDFNISVRSYNTLRRGNVRYLYEAILYYPDGFASFRNMGAKSIDEICSIIENYVLEHYEQITAYMSGEGVALEDPVKIDIEQETDPFKLTILQLLMHPIYKEKAKKYLLENNIPVEQMGLSVRSVNAFMRSNILSFYDALSVYPDNLSSLRNIGAKSIDEIKTRMEYYISKMQNAVSAYCSGDMSAMYSDEFVFDTVMSCFEDIGFKGISFKQIRDVFPDEFDETRIKQCIGGLLADKKLEYVDFRLYRVYPSVYSVIEQSSLEYEEKDILQKKLDGMTLEAIAQEYGVTRERIRQKFEKNFKKLRAQLQTNHGFFIFDEDYYAYLYSNYEVIKEMWLDFLGVPGKTFSYLVNSHAKGKRQISEALSDPKIDLILKFKIQDYLNRNKILIDGQLIERQRSDIEDYVLSKIAIDELSYDEFVCGYNEILKNNNIEYDEKIYYTEEVRRTRSHRLNESMFCLWKQGERLRYYDISSQDYEELLQTLNLGKYTDIELSTLKFIEDFPEIMEKYDIRDQYELHNLLKKIVDVNDYHDMVFHRQPMIQFGEFDRDKAIYSVLEAVAPVTGEELAEYVHMEFGYDKTTTMWNYFSHLNKYYHQGVYTIDFKKIPDERITLLREKLTDEFYYISEVKEIYKEMFGDVDLEEINPFSLKSIGFAVFTTYVIQNFQTAESYFTHLLTSQDVYDISTLNGKFMNIKTYYCVYIALRQNYDIFLFDKNQAITMNRLSKLGITKEDIKKFCDDVVEFAEEGTCFTMHSLREAGFVSELDDLGFDDYFYAGILAMDPRFMWQHVFGAIVLSINTGRNEKIISKKSFLIYALSKYDSVDLDDFISDCLEEYGINISDRYEITRAVAGTDMYYDSIMAKVYRNKNCYYAEFDD